MTGRTGPVLARLLAVFLFAGVGFYLLHAPFRRLEAQAAAALVRWVGATDKVFVDSPTSVEVIPQRHPAFRAEVTPTCSSLPSLLAIVCLSSLAPRHRRRRLPPALGAATATVVAGNVVRIAGSLGVGLFAGRSSLVLFHDWVGSVFAFAYTLGGYVLLLFLLLPHRPSPSETATCQPPSRSPSPPLAGASF